MAPPRIWRLAAMDETFWTDVLDQLAISQRNSGQPLSVVLMINPETPEKVVSMSPFGDFPQM
jgi:hypothetical protein